MITKKSGVIGLFSLAMVLSMNFVSAARGDTFDQVLESVSGAIKFILGDVTGISGASAGEVFLIKLLVFILLFIVVNVAVQRVPQFGDKKGISILISFVVSLIAIRFITAESLINFIWLPYGILGIFISSLFPFIIGYFFIESFKNSAMRKIGWAAYLIIFASLAYMRWENLKVGTLWYQNLGWIYVAIAILSLVLILFDRMIRSWKMSSSLQDVTDANKRTQARRIQREIDELLVDKRHARTKGEQDDVQSQINSAKARQDAVLS